MDTSKLNALSEVNQKIRDLNQENLNALKDIKYNQMSTTDKIKDAFEKGVGNQLSALKNMGTNIGKTVGEKVTKGLSFLKVSKEKMKEDIRQNTKFMQAVETFAESSQNFFKAGADKVKEKFSFLGPIGTLLKGLIIGGALFLLLKKLPEIFNSELYKQMIEIIKTKIIPGIKYLYNNFIEPFLMFFVDGLTNLFKDINDDSKSAGDVIKENGKLLAASIGAIALYLYPKLLFKSIAVAGKTIEFAGRKLLGGMLGIGKAQNAASKGFMEMGKQSKQKKGIFGFIKSLAPKFRFVTIGLKSAFAALLSPIGLVIGALTLAAVSFKDIKERWDESDGILGKIKIIISSMLGNLLKPFLFIGEKLASFFGFEELSEKISNIDPISAVTNFFNNIGDFIKEKFAIVGDFFSNIDPIGAVKNFFGKIGEKLSNLLPDFKLPEISFPDFSDFNPIDGLLSALANILDKFTFLGIGPKIAEFMRGAITPDEDVEEVEKRQKGGPVKKDSLYLVGEKGPELFRPSMSGMIANSQRTTDISNRAMENALAAMKGMGQSVQNIISAPTQNVENKTENKVAIGVGTLDDNFRQLATFSF